MNIDKFMHDLLVPQIMWVDFKSTYWVVIDDHLLVTKDVYITDVKLFLRIGEKCMFEFIPFNGQKSQYVLVVEHKDGTKTLHKISGL